MTVVVRVLAGLSGAALAIVVFDAAIRTFLLPRSASVRLTKVIARSVGAIFTAIANKRHSYQRADQTLSLYPPVLLLSFQACWLALMLIAGACAFIAAGAGTLSHAIRLSGSALFTLGSEQGSGWAQVSISYIEAGIGLTLLALLISFLPTLYASFQRREIAVTRLVVRAGSPATPWGVLEIAQSAGSLDRLQKQWEEFETWFIELGEVQVSLPILNFYRSPLSDRSWVATAASILDAASLYQAVLSLPPSPQAGLCIRSGWLNLRLIADAFSIDYPAAPSAADPITITRSQFDLVVHHLESSGVEVVSDLDKAWHDFVGWRVNYDAIVNGLASRFATPLTNWDLVASQPPIPPSNRRS